MSFPTHPSHSMLFYYHNGVYDHLERSPLIYCVIRKQEKSNKVSLMFRLEKSLYMSCFTTFPIGYHWNIQLLPILFICLSFLAWLWNNVSGERGFTVKLSGHCDENIKYTLQPHKYKYYFFSFSSFFNGEENTVPSIPTMYRFWGEYCSSNV